VQYYYFHANDAPQDANGRLCFSCNVACWCLRSVRCDVSSDLQLTVEKGVHERYYHNLINKIMSIKGSVRESILVLLLLLVVFTTNAADTNIAEDSINGVVNEWKRHHLRSGDDASHSDRQLKQTKTKRPSKKETSPLSQSVRSYKSLRSLLG
jgi:hypothetical protein